jgi:hypothetical protein
VRSGVRGQGPSKSIDCVRQRSSVAIGASGSRQG